MLSGIRHLFWDFDGTLYNSYPQVTLAFGQALRALGLEGLFSPDDALGLLKVSVYHAAQAASAKSGLDVQIVMDTFHRFHDAQRDFPPYDGLRRCLMSLRDAGCRHYLYTHRDRLAIEVLERDGLWPLFSDAVIRTDGFPDKPAPDALIALMSRNGVDPSQAAMVGDRDIDINAGHNAGMAGILFDPDGFYPDLRAELRVGSMDELRERLLHP